MSRSAEFCWIAEIAESANKGIYVMAVAARIQWTDDPEMALRITQEGRESIQRAAWVDSKTELAFRKVLAS